MPEIRLTTLLRLAAKIVGIIGLIFFIQLLGSLISVPAGSAPIYSAVAVVFLAILLISSILALLS